MKGLQGSILLQHRKSANSTGTLLSGLLVLEWQLAIAGALQLICSCCQWACFMFPPLPPCVSLLCGFSFRIIASRIRAGLQSAGYLAVISQDTHSATHLYHLLLLFCWWRHHCCVTIKPTTGAVGFLADRDEHTIGLQGSSAIYSITTACTSVLQSQLLLSRS